MSVASACVGACRLALPVLALSLYRAYPQSLVPSRCSSILLIAYHNTSVPYVKSAKDIYDIGLAIGFDYATDAYVNAAIARETNTAQIAVQAPKININNPNVIEYWWGKRVTDTFFDAGQIERGHLPVIKRVFQAVINMRQTVTRADTGAPTQEATNLMNVGGSPNVYNFTTIDGVSYYFPLRQTRRALLANNIRTNASRAASWVANFEGQELDSDNFEIWNPEEFGDREIGYNETVQRLFFEENDFPYFIAPIGGQWLYTAAAYLNFRPSFAAAQALGKKPILAHCRTGYRTGFFSITHEAYSTGKNSAWAFEVARSIGYTTFITDVGPSTTWRSLLNETNPNPPGYGFNATDDTSGAATSSALFSVVLAAIAATASLVLNQ